ncbi:heme exporter protein CcmB [Gilvimarinus polysaccharolyticus]|uniref:heme exporter protein CcmB n=1 Tax=Gilvimarinus polysaccharolyticus TaxID=863921 RepID=UPI0006736824|nr:heme exporter protein CcmB [Gilvimarinus polysaccharolyticus]
MPIGHDGYQVGTGFKAILRRDLTSVWRNRSDIASPLVFFLISITLLPLGVDPSDKLLAVIAPGMIWIMALLATLLSLDSLFRQDYDDGSLTQFILSPQPLYLTVLAKVIVHWLTTGLPLALIAPVLGVMLSLPAGGYWPLVLSLIIGTAIMSLIGAMGAALTVCLRSSALVLTLIVMPLYLPVLIIGSNTVSSSVAGFGAAQGLALLGAALAMALLVMPVAAAGALRISSNH